MSSNNIQKLVAESGNPYFDCTSLINDHEHSDEFDNKVHDFLEYVQDHLKHAVKGAEEDAEIHAPEHVENLSQIPAPEFNPFGVTFRSEDGMVYHSEHRRESDVMMHAHDLLGDFAVVPSSPLVSVTVR